MLLANSKVITMQVETNRDIIIYVGPCCGNPHAMFAEYFPADFEANVVTRILVNDEAYLELAHLLTDYEHTGNGDYINQAVQNLITERELELPKVSPSIGDLIAEHIFAIPLSELLQQDADSLEVQPVPDYIATETNAVQRSIATLNHYKAEEVRINLEMQIAQHKRYIRNTQNDSVGQTADASVSPSV